LFYLSSLFLFFARQNSFKMKFLFFIVVTAVGFPLFGQSKKELTAEKQKLQTEAAQLHTEINQLKSEIEELKKPAVANVTDTTGQASYCLGVVMASNMQSAGLDSLDMETFMIGLKDVFANHPLKIDRAQAEATIQQYMQQAMMKKSAIIKQESQKFLDTNKTKSGVKTTASGLQYEVLTIGKGKSPSPTDRVTVHYTGKLPDGSVFDSSVQRGQPATFGVNQVIPGWTEALQLMKEGDKWMLYIPYGLGYGERGAPPQIPPFSTLIFEVELLKVN
jgi:FKBP-type peptidyl-prolyl cis-trans isomerase/cell division protein FtsL